MTNYIHITDKLHLDKDQMIMFIAQASSSGIEVRDSSEIFAHTDHLVDIFGFYSHFVPPGDLFGRYY